MARRHAEKTATQGAAGRGASARAEQAGPAKGTAAPRAPTAASRIDSLESRLIAMEQERDFLRAQAEALKTRVRTLEEAQAQARNRLAWAIDTVQSILDKKC